MLLIKRKHRILVRTLAIGMICLFVLNDIAWADPNAFAQKSHADSLQAPLFSVTTNISHVKYVIATYIKLHPAVLKQERHIVYKENGEELSIYFHPKNSNGEVLLVPCLARSAAGSKRYVAVLMVKDAPGLDSPLVGVSEESGVASLLSGIKARMPDSVPQEVIDNASLSNPASPASIPDLKKTFAPDMTRKEYAVRRAWWVEEIFFFSLPLITRSFLIMALARGIFYFWHPDTRGNAPPGKYMVPLCISVAGILLSFPVIALGAYCDPAQFILADAAASIVMMLAHREMNIYAILNRLGAGSITPDNAAFSDIKYDPRKLAYELASKCNIQRNDIAPVSAAITSEYLKKIPTDLRHGTHEKLKLYLSIVASAISSLSNKKYGISVNKDTIIAYLTDVLAIVPEEARALVVAKFDRIRSGQERPLVIKLGNVNSTSSFDFSANAIAIDAGTLFLIKKRVGAEDHNTAEIFIASVIGRQIFGYFCRTPEELSGEGIPGMLDRQDAAFLGFFLKRARGEGSNDDDVFSVLSGVFNDIKGPSEVLYTSLYSSFAEIRSRYAIPDTINKRYIPLSVLGEGGMGVVLLAYDTMLGGTVAIKIAKSDRLGKAGIIRFKREIESTKKIDSQSIVKILDEGEYGAGANAYFFYAMEYYPWPTLKNVIDHTELSLEESCTIMLPALEALQDIHAGGIVHRDIKPENIMISPDRKRLVIMDFGLGKELGSETYGVTMTGQGMGTPYYMSPEQITDSKAADFRSDVFAMGVILYEMVTRKKPFGESAKNANVIILAVMNEDARMPSSINQNVDPDLDAIIMKALAKNSGERYQSVAEMKSDLEWWLKQHQSLRGPANIPSRFHMKLKRPAPTAARKNTPVFKERRDMKKGVKQAPERGEEGRKRSGKPSVKSPVSEGQRPWLTPLKIGGIAVAAISLAVIVALAARSAGTKSPETGKERTAKEEKEPSAGTDPGTVAGAIDLSKGLIAHWKMNDNGSGPTLVDSAGNYNAKWTRDTSLDSQAGKINGSLSADGKNYAIVDSAACGDFEYNQPFSVSAWTNRASLGAYHIILGKMTLNNTGWVLFYCKDNSIKVRIAADNTTDYARVGLHRIQAGASSAPITNQWVHVVMTYDGSHTAKGIKIYKNGVLQPLFVECDTLGADTIRNSARAEIGSHGGGNSKFNGKLDDLRIYNTVLSADQVKALYNNDRGTEKTSVNMPSGKEGGGSWWNNPVYTRYFAWLETPVALSLAALLPVEHSAWAWLAAGSGFWFPHLIGNRQTAYTRDVAGLTIATALTAALFPICGPLSFVSLLTMGALTFWHLLVNLRHTASIVTASDGMSMKAEMLGLDPAELDMGVKDDSGKKAAILPTAPGQEKKAIFKMPEVYDGPMLRDIKDPGQLALCIADELISLAGTKKVVLAFDNAVAAGQAGSPMSVVRYLEEMKRDDRYRAILERLEILPPKTPERLAADLKICSSSKDTVVFMFAMSGSRDKLKDLGPQVRPSFIDSQNLPLSDYYPIAEVVAIALAQYFDNVITTDGTITKINLKNSAILDLNKINIASLSCEQGVLIFKLLPNSEKHDLREPAERYRMLKELLANA